VSITKTGIWTSEDKYTYLVNNFTETKTSTDWTLGGSVNSSGIAVLTGTTPAFSSKTFTLGDNDIIAVEFNCKLPTPSTGADGFFLGTTASANTNRYYYNTATQTWGSAQSNANSSWNTYQLSSYNLNTPIYIKTYLIGKNVDINDVPPTITTNSAKNPPVIQYTGTNSVAFRSGYNSGNTSMVIHIWNMKVYNINSHNFTERAGNASIYTGGTAAPCFYEI